MKKLWALLALSLVGCSSFGPSYFVDETSDADEKYLADDGAPISGEWRSPSDLRVVLYTGVSDGAKLRPGSLSAEVSGDLIVLHFDVDRDPDRKDMDPIALCEDRKKLVFILHGLTRQAYRVRVASTYFGKPDMSDVESLTIRN